MSPSKFDEIVKNRTQQVVGARSEQFRADIRKAIEALYGQPRRFSGYRYWTPDEITMLKKIMEPEETRNKGWPHELWAEEAARISESLLSTMDEMAKALAAPKPADDGPQPETIP